MTSYLWPTQTEITDAQLIAMAFLLFFGIVILQFVYRLLSDIFKYAVSRFQPNTNLGRYDIYYDRRNDIVSIKIRPNNANDYAYSWWSPSRDYLIFASDVSKIARTVAEDIEEMYV